MDPHSKPPCCRVSLAEICSLYQKLFQTPADMRSVQAAVDKIYWDFQLLDFNRDSSLSLSDVKILLQKAQESQVTSMSWVDFLTQRQETSNRVTWAELEAWLFTTSSSMRHGTLGASTASFHENDQLQYQGEMMDESRRLKNQWDAGGLEVLVRAAEGTTHARGYPLINQKDLTEAVDHKYAALNEKLFCDMLQAHYGSQAWASMNDAQKEQNMNDLKMLLKFGLERGSELVLSQLPGAAHNFRDEENSCSCQEAKKKWIAIEGLKDLQRRLKQERSILTSYNEGQSDSICHAQQYLLLFAQKIKVKIECNFSAALLVVEPYWKQRFWDEKPVCLETCFEELAHIRLTTGQRMKQKFEKEHIGLKKLSMEEDKLLSLLKRQEEARGLLFQLLQSCSHEELQEPMSSLLHSTSEENTEPIKEVSENKVGRNPLRQLFLLAMTVTKTCLLDDRDMVTWGDCAVRLLVQVQLKQELELRELILELSRGIDNDDKSGQLTKGAVLEENDPVSYLIHLLQPITPKEQLHLEQFKAELVSSLECTKVHEELDNKNFKEAFDNQGMIVNIRKQEETKTLLKNNNTTNITIVDQQKKDDLKNDDLHVTRLEECSIREKPPEKIHRRQMVRVSSMLKECEKEQGHQWDGYSKERNLPMDTLYKGSGKGTSEVAASMQNEQSEQAKHEQVPSDELASSVMEATESLIAGLMTLKAKVEEVYMKRGTDRHSLPRSAGSDVDATSPENLSSNLMEAAESLIVSLKALKEGMSHAAKSQLIEHSGEPIIVEASKQQNDEEVATKANCEDKPSSSSVGNNVDHLEDSKKHDESLGVQSDLVPCPMTREVSWELHPQCSQDCSHAKLWDSEVRREQFSGGIMAGTDCSAVSGSTSSEDKKESLNCGLKCLDEKPKTLLPEPLPQREEQAADTETMSYASAEKKQTDCHQEDNEKVLSGDSSIAQEEGRDDIAMSTVDSSSEDGAPEQGSADELAMSFLEATQNFIGELIPGKEGAGLSSVRRVVVILADSENGDLILGQGEDMSEVNGTISTLEESSGGESQVVLSKDEEETDDHTHVPVNSNKADCWELHADCVMCGNIGNLQEDCPEGEPSTKLMEVKRQPPIPDTGDAERMTRHSQGCDGIGKSQCRKRVENEKENQVNKLTSEKLVSTHIKEANPQVPSKVKTVTEDNFLPTDKEMRDNDTHDVETPMCCEELKMKNEDKNKKGDNKTPGQKFDCGNNTINVATSERGDPLTQDEAGIDDPVKHYRESVKDEETETGVTISENFNQNKSVHLGDVEQINDETCLCTGQNSMTNEDKADETHGCNKLSQSELCPNEESPGTLVKSVLLSTQDLIGSLTSLKEKMGKNDKIVRLMKTDNNNLSSAEVHTNEHKKADIQEESCSKFCESTPNMLLNVSYVSASSEEQTVQEKENPSARSEKVDQNAAQDDKERPTEGASGNKSTFQKHEKEPSVDHKAESMVDEEAGLTEKECLSHSSLTKSEAEGMILVNQVHKDWKKKWRSVCERHMDKQRKCDDGSTLEKIKLHIIEKSNSEFVCNKQRLRSPSPTTTAPLESEKQEEDTQTSSRHEHSENSEHMDGIQGKEGDLVTESKTTGTEHTNNDPTTAMCSNNNEQGSIKDLTISLLEATNSLIGRLGSLKEGLGRSQRSESFVSCKEIEQNVPDIKEQRFDVRATYGAPVSLMVETEQNDRTSDVNKNGNRAIIDISTNNNEYYRASNDESMNNHPIQETSVNEEFRRPARCEETKVESSEVVFSITRNTGIIQSNLNLGEHCHMQKDTQLQISTHFVETSHETGNTETTQMQLQNETQIFQEEIGPKAQLTKHQVMETPPTSESIIDIEQAMTKEVLSNTSYCLKVSHMQVTDDPLAKWKSIVMHKIKVSSEDNMCEMHKIKLDSVNSEPLTSGNNEDMNVDPLNQTENQLNEAMHQELYRKKMEQVGGAEMKDLEEMQTLRSFIRNGVIKRKREDAEEREEEKQNRENKTQYNEKKPDQLNKPGPTTSSELCQGTGSESTDLHQLISFDNIHVKYRSCEVDAVIKGSMKEETLIDHEITKKDIKAEERLFGSKNGTEHQMELSQVPDLYMSRSMDAERQSMAIIKEKQSPWLQFWEAANQAIEVAAVSATQSSNFFGHVAQVPANGVLVRNEKQLSCPLHTFDDAKVKSSTLKNISETSHETKKQEYAVSNYLPQICSLPTGQAILQREKVFIRLSLREQQEAMQRLTDLQREAELKCASDRRRQMLRFQERLSIARNRKSELDLMSIPQRRSPKLSPEPSAEEDVERQKSAVKEHLEKVKRERTYIMQTKRDRNMTSFRELLDPVLTGKKREDSGSELKGVEGL